MRILVACLDQELLWVIDDVIGGLYSIDLKTFEMKCVVDCQKLFPCGKFDVLSLFKWKENYIVIVPLEINKSWIFYNKVTGEIGYRTVIERRCQEILIATDQDRDQLYFFPLYVNDPILIFDLNTLTCSQIIENWSEKVPNGCHETAWKGVCNGQYIFFPVKNTRTLVRMNCDTGKVDLLELDIAESVVNADYAFGELWVLPINGNKIYHIDENGLIVNTVELLVEDVTDPFPDFARIIVHQRYLFILPYCQKRIYIYDKLYGTTRIISHKNLVSEKKDKDINLQYWEYYIKDNRICFLPFGDEYMEIDLGTFEYKERKLTYPNIWSEKEKIRRIIWSHVSERDSIIREADGCGTNIFLEYVQYNADKENFIKRTCVSKKVWNVLKI